MEDETLRYIINHLFLPVRLPDSDDHSIVKDLAICDLVIDQAAEFAPFFGPDVVSRWNPVMKMLRTLRSLQSSSTLDAKEVLHAIKSLTPGDVLVLPIRAQNACVLLRKDEREMTCESFEVDPPNAEVMGTVGRLVCSYPGPAVTIPDKTALEPAFQSELALFLAKMDADILDSMSTTVKAKSTVPEARDTADPHYITQLLTAILRGLPGSKIADVKRIAKHLRNDIIWHNSHKPWRRSSLWLIIRVALQTTLRHVHRIGGTDDGVYKAFMAFLMAEVMCLKECFHLSTDVLHCMRTKVARRLHKLHAEAPHVVIRSVTFAVQKITALLENRWSNVQSGQKQSIAWAPAQLDITSDTHLSLLQSTGRALDPHEFSIALRHDPCVALVDMEDYVQQDLDVWVEAHHFDTPACVNLAHCITLYSNAARTQYAGNPEDESMLLLTVFQMWIALDQLAITQHRLLSEYSPEIPDALLQPLLLRKGLPIRRLIHVQHYIRERFRRAHKGSIFTDAVSPTSFAIQYFSTSRELQDLKATIERDARSRRDAKHRELEGAKKEYNLTLVQARSQDHAYKDDFHDNDCNRCRLETKAANMKIDVYEWPLPEDELSAESVVFELRCPTVFQIWRTTTYEILYDICRPGQPRLRPTSPAYARLGKYPGLLPYVGELSRITYASSAKSFSSSHYSFMSVANAEFSTLCVNNGLRFRLFDDIEGIWASRSFSDCSVDDLCTFKMPVNSPYHLLQYAISGTSHTSNAVIAQQSDVPPELSLHEHDVFGTLRSGPRLQWLNISRELRARTMSFAHPDVQLLVLQAAFQVGPVLQSVNDLEWHAILQNPTFGTTLLSEIEDFVESIEDNWLHVTTLQTFILLITRLLASVEDQDVICNAFDHLKRCRKIAFKWLQQVTSLLRDTEDDAAISDHQHRICMVAATCRSTYDVEPQHLQEVLASDEDVTVFVQCAICLHDNVPPTNPPNDLKRLLSRDRRLSQRVAFTLWTRVEQSQTGLDCAIASIWAAYRRGSQWKQLPKPNNRWITTTATAEPATSVSSTVHLNLFDGALLINGKPLGRLPFEIVTNPTYIRILGQKILDIIPSDIPNMDFATRGDISSSGFHLHFKLQAGNLIIQAKQGLELYELIPHYHFKEDFPNFFTERYAHWLYLSPKPSPTATIEFRPMDVRWVPSQKNWHLKFSPLGFSTMQLENLYMLDIRSPSFRMVSSTLKPLESPQYLHTTTTGNGDLSVELPRYKLSFTLNNGQELESNNMRNMVVDTDPSGTMVGLASQLILKSINPAQVDLPRSRCVIIPFGDIVCQPTHHHVNLVVDLGNNSSVRYFVYDVDTSLRCLVGTTLLSDLYKILLHASTSFPVADPLTQCTGMEEALSELSSARCFSFQTLGAEEFNLLSKIASLAPDRKWYPRHLKVMQTIKWGDIGPLAQHWGFGTHVRAILRYHAELSIFDKSDKPWIPLANAITKADVHLHNRAASRNYYLYPREHAFYDPSVAQDRSYPSQDGAAYNRSGASLKRDVTTRAADVSAMVQMWPQKLHTIRDLWTTLHSFGGQISNDRTTRPSISYGSDLLHPMLSELWIPLYNRCRKGRDIDRRFALAFSLPAMAYGSPQYVHLIPTLLAFATVPQFAYIAPPDWETYQLSMGIMPDNERLLKIVSQYAQPLLKTPSLKLERYPRESNKRFQDRRELHRQAAYKPQANSIVQLLSSQWPCEQPSFPSNADFPLINVESREFRVEVTNIFRIWHRNMQLYNYVGRVQAVLDVAHRSSSLIVPSSVLPYDVSYLPVSNGRHQMPSLAEIAAQRHITDVPTILTPAPLRPPLEGCQDSDTLKLASLLDEFTSSSLRGLRRRYRSTLEESRKSYMESQMDLVPSSGMTFSFEQLIHHRELCRNHFDRLFDILKRIFSPTGDIEQVGYLTGQWPRITIRSLLGRLSTNSNSQLTEEWRAQIILLAQSLVRLQHSERLMYYAASERMEEFTKELSNDRFEQDMAFNQYPEWLLIQIEGNFLVRPLQTRVAREMMSPTSNENTVLQLNMGEGKSSVIVPLISSCLADGEKLVRVVVLKPLAQQMFQLLVLRLSGLANRRIFYFPFSRDVQVTPRRAQQLQSLYELCMQERGVLVVQPEHILSFKLMGIDLTVSGKGEQAAIETLLESQRWLTSKSRDILDESDEILSVNYQLVYTSGLQAPMEGHPDRWLTIQEILSYTKRHARRLQVEFSVGLEVEMIETASFPLIRILNKDAGDELILAVARELINKERFRLLPGAIREAAFEFVTGQNDGEVEANQLEEQCKDANLWKCLLLCRGLLGSGGILRFVLQQKRWRVDYGLDPTRTLLAVPYRAKDVPSLRADFGHPDVAIALTCLSYYYGGLTAKELDLCFELLFKLDNPSLEYEAWVVDDHAMPTSLRTIVGVNLDDVDQRKNHLFPLFYRNHATINFYLSNIVFPKEAKQFPKKLATSAWDLAETKSLPTTGFSGTNDNRDLLPTSIEQRDPLDQLSTNARVLSYLLQPENDHYICLQRDGQPLASRDFLELIVQQSPPVRVLLDVGAQMLDLRNTELARTWLSLEPNLYAVVFFDDADHLVVMSRDQSIEPFISSQYNQNLDLCGIYLDDAHTRGTDLKLPVGFRAAVTLGPKLTKDRLVQGCMRMRKLGHGHSVMFFAPVEVDRSIRQLKFSESEAKVEVLDILRWVMSETCNYIENHMSHWAQQGVEYGRRREAWSVYDGNPSAVGTLNGLRLSWEEPDARSLQEMYSPSAQPNAFLHPAFQVPDLDERLRALGIYSLGSSQIDEEQEREVSHEAERERHVERPPKAEPAQHKVHRDVISLVATGADPTISPAFMQLFSPLRHFGSHPWSASLWATKDFSTTVKDSSESATDYLRPVNWILSVASRRLLIALSPYEVNELLPLIGQSQHVHLHIYFPRVTKAMKSFEDLKFFCIPPLPPSWTPPFLTDISQLNLWAGQLYLKDFEAYSHLCLILGLVRDETTGVESWESDGFVKPEHRRGGMVLVCKLSESPLPFLKNVMGLRRKGMNYLSTHMGKILNAGLLTEDDFRS